MAPSLDDKDQVDQTRETQWKKVSQRFKIFFTAQDVCVIFSRGLKALKSET
jgi:hypothetical protein